MAGKSSLTVLVDNNTLTDHYFSGEPGLSFLIRTAGKTILFDTGYSGLFIRNAEMMGISLLELDWIVLSHGHLDHTGGLQEYMRYLTGAMIEGRSCTPPGILSHPYCFYPRPKQPLANIGSIVHEDEVKRHFNLVTSAKPFWITGDLVFLGQVGRTNEFEVSDPGNREIIMPGGHREKDFLVDDSALALKTSNGLVIITGCSHAGICNTVETARKICGEERVLDIIGGLHLLTPERAVLEKTREYLQGLGLHGLFACHCTSLGSKFFLSEKCPVIETGVGMTFEWE